LLTLQDEILGEVAVELPAQAIPDIVATMRTLDLAQIKFSPGDLKEARGTLQEVLDYLRALMYDFDPLMLALTDMRGMLRDYAVSFKRKRDLPVILNVSGDGVEVPKRVRKAVFRVFEEGLNNAWRQAEANKVRDGQRQRGAAPWRPANRHCLSQVYPDPHVAKLLLRDHKHLLRSSSCSSQLQV
jgi:signal transduction histidine kinase